MSIQVLLARLREVVGGVHVSLVCVFRENSVNGILTKDITSEVTVQGSLDIFKKCAESLFQSIGEQCQG